MNAIEPLHTHLYTTVIGSGVAQEKVCLAILAILAIVYD